jgi:DMSO/TMAO reductase YedYZ molybdopterin-dependent catalytic subunit
MGPTRQTCGDVTHWHRGRRWGTWVSVALAAGLGALAGSYLVVGRQPAWVVTRFDRLVLAITPDAVVGLAIVSLQGLAHQLAFAVAIALAAAVLGLATLPAALALADRRAGTAIVLGTGLPGLATVALTGGPTSGLGAGAGAGLVILVGAVAGRVRHEPDGAGRAAPRRQVLATVGTAFGVGGVGLLTRGRGAEASPAFVGPPENARPAVRDKLRQAREQSLDVEGLEPLVSTDFYEVDINNVNPDIDESAWSLSVTGAVETEVELDMAAVRDLPVEDRFVTLRCVGDYPNGYQIDTALWSGVPMSAILDRAQTRGEYVVLRAHDSYFNEFPIDALRPGLLAYRMNGRPLPRGHGAPARALVPGHWGEVNVKWLTEIEVSDEPVTGYWEERGWHGTGPVHTVAKLHQTNHLGPGRVEVAGHAYAGTRGIRAVEVSADGGETWAEAELSEPLPGEDVWRQWRHRYLADERHEVVVRAIDGTGARQIPDQADPRPSGATGWVSERVEPE